MAEANEGLLGRVAVAAKLITLDQLNAALREQGETNGATTLGDVLVEMGLLTPRQLQQLLKLQERVLARGRGANAAADKAPPTPDPVVESPAVSPVPRSQPTPEVEIRGAESESRPLGAASTGGLEDLLRAAVDAGASDIHIHSGAPIKFRARTRIYDHGSAPLEKAQAEQLLFEALDPTARETFEEYGEADFCYTLEGVGRFRGNVYRQLRGTDGVFRFIPKEPPSLEQLGLPSDLARFTTFHQGMVLITGPKSCGKSSTLAALVNLINQERPEHILTIEDPIEYLHPSRRCLVNQRSAHRHTMSFSRALRAALREDPDVIVIGELRDRETIGLALTAAETGHFVLATLHTDSSIRTIDRLIGAFPPDQQEQVRAMISESLKAVVTQRLVPTADEQSVVPALEVLSVTRAVGNLIREKKTVQIRSLIQTGAAHGMRLLDTSLRDLLASGRISKEVALRFCEDPKRILG